VYQCTEKEENHEIPDSETISLQYLDLPNRLNWSSPFVLVLFVFDIASFTFSKGNQAFASKRG
jgi:hypothetical protein